MKNKYISKQSSELLKYFNEQNLNCFDYSLVQQASFTRLQYEYQLCLAQLELARLTGAKYWE